MKSVCSHHKAVRLIFFLPLVVLLAALTLTACDKTRKGGDETIAESAPQSVPATEAPTEPDTDAPATEEVTTPATDADTEPETEPETQPASDRTISFYEDFPVDDVFSGTGYEFALVTEGDEQLLSVKRTADRAPRVTVKFDTYLKSLGAEPITSDRAKYIVANVRKGSPEHGKWETMYIAVSSDSLKSGSGNAIKSLYLTTFASMTKDSAVWYLRDVSVASSLDEALLMGGMTQYVLGYGSTLDLSASDPVNHVKITAPDEDESVSFWFDHFTEKVNCDTVPVKDTVGYTIQMAKNEYEACQFFLSAPTDRHFTVQYTPFINEAGASLYTELRVEFYPTEGAGLTIPDCLIPYEDYVGFEVPEDCAWSYDVRGCVTVPANTTRGFVMQTKTTTDSAPGLYSADVSIYDADSGKCVKTAKVYTYVYDVTLSEETAMKTQVLCWSDQWLTPYYDWGYVHNDVEALGVLYELCDFLLDYRICTQANFGEEWLNNPRVTGVGVGDGSEYQLYVAKNRDWNKKFILYKVDEPAEPRRLEELKTISTSYREGWEDVNIVCPFETDINYDGTDQIDYMSRYLNIWCPKFYSFTPRELSFIKGTQYTQTKTADEKYGTFEARMAEYRERGDETWVYVSCLPTWDSPYLNVLLQNDGTQPETMFWMCYRYDITGFLYWNLFYWQNSGYGNGYLRYPVTKTGPGDGILLYPGCAYGSSAPMPSMRLVGIRDGIEDYQLLTMLEAACGKEMTDDLVSHIATSVVTFNTDDDVLHNARVFLLKTLEAAGK